VCLETAPSTAGQSKGQESREERPEAPQMHKKFNTYLMARGSQTSVHIRIPPGWAVQTPGPNHICLGVPVGLGVS
jgi:hypothetical protein